MCRTFPAWRSVTPPRSSCPHGLSTLPASARPISGVGILPDPDDVLQRREPRLDRRAVGRLCVNPDQRLGPARPQQHPPAVFEVELETAVAAYALHAHPPHLLRFVLLQRFDNSL